MPFFLLLWSAITSILATAIMSYICMATPIGPWIETTIVLMGTITVHMVYRTAAKRTQALGLSTVAAGMGGIIATACGFSFPTLYFLKPDLFNAWLAQPVYFCAVMAGLVIAASCVGLLVAHSVAPRMLADPTMPFSIGQLTQKMIVAQNQIKKSYELVSGIITSIVLACAQAVHMLPQALPIVPKISWGVISIHAIAFRLDLFPMLLAIGFITGTVLTIPLAVGVFSKFFILEPLHRFAFPMLTYENFILAFFSGIVVQSALMSFMDFPSFIKITWRRIKLGRETFTVHKNIFQNVPWYIVGATAVCIILFLCHFNFSLLAQLYVIGGAAVCSYQLILIAGKIGLAPLGRFATFVMVPGLVLFGFNAVQAVLVATFVEISGGVAVDTLFGRTMGNLAHIEQRTITQYQLWGILVSAASIGIIFWLLIHHFGLGSSELFAGRAQSRALLINAYNFDYYVLALGVLFGCVLKYFKVNPILVLGGLAMSVDISLMLIIGGVSASRCKDPEDYYSYWSGVFATSSLIMIVKALL